MTDEQLKYIREFSAEELFSAQINLMKYEERLVNALDALLGDSWDDYTYDYYDSSVEVYGVAIESMPTRESVLIFLNETGLGKIWLHTEIRGICGPCGCKCRAISRS